MEFITASQLKSALKTNDEIALLDVRERAPFSKEHLLMSSCVPLSQLELMISDLVPRFSTKIVVISNGPSDMHHLAERAAKRLCELDYPNVSVLEDGISGWRDAGFELFSGVNVLSKALGEIAAVSYNTPMLSPQEEQDKVKRNENLIILDSRPKNEYHRMTIPGSVDIPGAELVYRVHDMVQDPNTLIIVHCAGRTRSIIGAQSLINAGIPNPIVALENGTMGWQLAGFELEYDQTRFAPFPSDDGIAKAKTCIARVSERFGVRKIPYETLNHWKSESKERTTYIIDVRLPKEYEAGHIEGSRNVQGGQLIQATDEYIAVHNSRIVLVDDTEVRAITTASWLIQMGWSDVYVLENGITHIPLTQAPYQPRLLGVEEAETIEADELEKMLKTDEKIAIVDVASSSHYREQHVAGAWWGIRSRLVVDLSKLPNPDTLVLTSEDGLLALLTAQELKKLGLDKKVLVLDGGTREWINLGFPTAQGLERVISELDDIWYMPYLFPDAPEEAKRGYIDWEIALVEQVERDGTAKFKIFAS